MFLGPVKRQIAFCPPSLGASNIYFLEMERNERDPVSFTAFQISKTRKQTRPQIRPKARSAEPGTTKRGVIRGDRLNPEMCEGQKALLGGRNPARLALR